MKFYKFIILFLALSLAFAVNISRAQDEEENEPEEMTDEQWEQQIQDLTAKKTELTSKVAELQKEKTDLLAKVEAKKEEIKKAEDAYWTEVGGKETYNAFKSDLDKVEKLCKNKEGSKDDVMKKFDALNSSNLKCHPDFATKFRMIKECLAKWEDFSVPEYTVQKGDYLFIIAARKEVYNNKHMWPIIWEANENGVISAPGRIPKTIKNPHLVYPGQVLRIPKISESLKKSGIFDRARGWLDWKKGRTYHKKISSTKTEVKKDEKKDVKKEPVKK
ncbi:MAG: LysM peptidoglycan-binding domain-containing protein [Ignavibacteriae bacterium]|nr:LysM peptidoglycan-binding domain-containing protein [Ignavibacteriota bacterium]